MHRDHKLALALALLLIGVAAALCFPKQPHPGLAELQLDDADLLDAAIDLLPVRVYTESHTQPADSQPAADADEPPATSNPDLSDPFAGFALLPAAPDPIPTADIGPVPPTHPPDTPTPPESIRVEAWPSLEHDSPPPSVVVGEDIANVHEENRVPQVYRVQAGDTLSGLAGRFLGSTRRYLELYEANRDVLSSPDDLQVGMRLKVPEQGTSKGADTGQVRHPPVGESPEHSFPQDDRRQISDPLRFRPVRVPFTARSETADSPE
jgi:LysM domain